MTGNKAISRSFPGKFETLPWQHLVQVGDTSDRALLLLVSSRLDGFLSFDEKEGQLLQASVAFLAC